MRAVLLVLAAAGIAVLLKTCTLSYSVNQVTLAVIDAETGLPLADVQVRVGYTIVMLWPVLNPPPRVDMRTDSEGRSTFRVADLRPRVTLSLQGYREVFQLPLDASDCYALPSAFYEHSEADLTVPLYRLPEPTVTLVFPDGYRGHVAVELAPSAELIQEVAGRREFEFEVGKDGLVRIEATPLLCLQETLLDLTARFAGGVRLPRCHTFEPDATIALRPVVHMPRPILREVLVVGDSADFRRLHDELHRPSPNGGDAVEVDMRAFEAYFGR